MTISSANIEDPPVINPNWLLQPEDQEVAVAAYKIVRKMWEAVPIKVGDEVLPGAQYQTDAEILDQLQKSLVSPIHHASSSCKMGRRGDNFTVVDSNGRVVGVRRLRVIDSSSLPFTPPGHTQGYTCKLACVL